MSRSRGAARAAFTVGLGLLGCSADGDRSPPNDLPNVLLITADDLGLQLGVYGETRIDTPHLDALAADGIRFETAYVTQASCSASRSSLFTGLYPHGNGQYGLSSVGFSMHTEIGARILPTLLGEAGYLTGILGKIHVGPADAFAFDYAHENVDETRDVRLVARRFAEFVEQADGQPFFMMLNYSDPHAFLADDGSWYFPAQVEGLPTDPIGPSEVTLFTFQGVDSTEQRERVANYLNAVRRLDDGIGMVLAKLEQLGHSEDTLVIFVGDHGPPFERGKTTTYEAGLRVPLIVRWPGGERAVSTSMVSTADIWPTILEAAGLDPPQPMHGRSLLPYSRGETTADREHLVGEFHFHGRRPFFPRRAIRDRAGHKLIHNPTAGRSKPPLTIDGDLGWALSREPRYDGTLVRQVFDRHADPPEFELYDLDADPDEMIDLAGDPAWADIRQELLEALLRWQIDTDDPFRDPGFVDRMLAESMP